MTRFLAVSLFCLALLCGCVALHVRNAVAEADHEFAGRISRAPVPIRELIGSKPESPVQYEATLIEAGKFTVTVFQMSPPGGEMQKRFWFMSNEVSRMNITALNRRTWNEQYETLFYIGDAATGHRLFSLPFTLPTILTTLALLFLTAGGWLLWRDRRRRLALAPARPASAD
jgi:uncharacterized iron-regulated membrane protein